jgi:hypothetical protein
VIKPSDIKQVLPPGWEGFVPTKSGCGFHPLDPMAAEVRLSDIAYGLSYRYRYGCQTRPYTVAEHSVLVSEIIAILWPESKMALAGLMHDACEAYTHDIPSPVRRHISASLSDGTVVSWSAMERRVNRVVEYALSLPSGCTESPEVKAADMLAVSIEKVQIPELWKLGSWGLPELPQQLEGLMLAFYSPEEASSRFLSRYLTLGGVDHP